MLLLAAACTWRDGSAGPSVESTATPAPATPVPAASGQLAFVSNRDGNEEIYLIDADGSHQRRLTSSPGADDDPSWSPDGERIAFIHAPWPRALAQQPRPSPVFRLATLAAAAPVERPAVYVMDADGSQPRLVTDQVNEPNGPVWSPDGRRIAFTGLPDHDHGDIYVVDADGANLRNLTELPASDSIPVWSPDGRRIAFVSDRNRYPAIYVLDLESGELQRLAGGTADNSAFMPAWSPNGQRLAYAGGPASMAIHIVDTDGSHDRVLSPTGVGDFAPAWSPDGRQILFLGKRGDDRDAAAVYIMDADGANVRRLAGHGGQVSGASWSPDGRFIVFGDAHPTGPCSPCDLWHLHVVDADGAHLRTLVEETWPLGAVWRPGDGI